MCPQLSLWINEKMLTAQDMTYDEARNLHSKWLKHQAFMAELQSNKEWLDKIQKVRRALKYIQETLYNQNYELRKVSAQFNLILASV